MKEHYFAASDLPPNADLRGMILFTWAPYSAGTPEFDEFNFQHVTEPRRLAPHPLLSLLPMRLLGTPNGALAMIGHVDRSWLYSFQPSVAGTVVSIFAGTLQRLMSGYTVGLAMDAVRTRYSLTLAAAFEELRRRMMSPAVEQDQQLARVMTETLDLRNYIVIGDPAVSIRLPDLE